MNVEETRPASPARVAQGCLGLLLCLSLVLPWFSGQDDGKPLRYAGGQLEGRFTVALLAIGIAETLLALMWPPRPWRWIGVLGAGGAILLTAELISRGYEQSTPDLMWGAYVSVLVQIALLLAAAEPVALAGRRS